MQKRKDTLTVWLTELSRMLDNVCPNCGKKHYWYELNKRDPITKEQVCRNCNTPSRSKEIQQKTTTKKVLESSPIKKI